MTAWPTAAEMTLADIRAQWGRWYYVEAHPRRQIPGDAALTGTCCPRRTPRRASTRPFEPISVPLGNAVTPQWPGAAMIRSELEYLPRRPAGSDGCVGKPGDGTGRYLRGTNELG